MAEGLRISIQKKPSRFLELLDVLGHHSVELGVSMITVSESLRECHDFFLQLRDLLGVVIGVLEGQLDLSILAFLGQLECSFGLDQSFAERSKEGRGLLGFTLPQ
ncbi:hypothetical protein PR002_g8306 [Phytophthora rubi]|uniref:Uncharacterized protein n=1 Tax=Phytophthora rubi TaxID=129364 RepID=A0A6A3MZ99_9STRA|nr:hypothetical protein PR002_g8306 [Phytophthora rubi]